MKRPLFLRSLAVALLLTPVLAKAQPPDPPRRPDPGQDDTPSRRGGADRNLMQRRGVARAELGLTLGLTEAQQADMRKAVEASRRDRLRKSTDLKIANMDLKSLLRAEKVDEKTVFAKLAEVQAAQGALLKLRVDSALAMKRILTPEQQKKIGEMRGRPGMTQLRQRRPQMGRRRGAPREDFDFDHDDIDRDLDPDPIELDFKDIRPKGDGVAGRVSR